MMKRRMKTKAVFLALCMMVSAFALMSIPVMSDESIAGDMEAVYQDPWMEEQPAIPLDADKLIQFNRDQPAGNAYHLGDTNVAVNIQVRNNDAADAIYVDQATLLSNHGLFTPNSEEDDGDTIPAMGTWTFQFTFDIGNSGDVNFLYQDALTLSFEDLEQPPGNNIGDESFDFDVYVSSIFDPDAGDSETDMHEGLPDILETDGGNGYFEDGETMQEGQITLDNHAPYGITDIRTDLDVSGIAEDVVLSGGQNIALNPTGAAAGGSANIFYRLDIGDTASVPPDIYTGSMEVQYVRADSGDTIVEDFRPIDLTVDYTKRLTASITAPVTINQNDLEATLNVQFTNIGNVDLSEIMISSDPDGSWLDVAFHHYENDDDTYVTMLDIGSLDVGESSTAVDVVVATDMMLPDGIHRVPFVWNGWYYENGDTGDATRWVEVGGLMHDHDSDDETPEVGLLYEDVNENGIRDGGDLTLETMWTDIFVDFTVDDDNGLTWEAFVWDPSIPGPGRINAGDDGMVRYTTVEVRIFNFEFVAYTGLEASLTVGPTTPFLDPVLTNHASTTPLPMDPTSPTTVPAGAPGLPGQVSIFFTVDINAAWWQDNSLIPETYWATMTVDATNDDSEERITGTTVDVKTDIVGFGPELFASMVTITDFGSPGDEFTMSVEITNFGDDIAREVDAYLMADFVSGWTILDQFVTSISSYGGTGPMGNVGDASWGWSNDQWHTYWTANTQWNRSNDIKPSDIGVDNVPQIVELYDWIKRRESPPQGVLLWMHLDRLAPGETYTFVFEMVSDVNMVEGMVYYETIALYYHDSNGDDYGPNGAPMGTVEDHYAPPQQLLIRKGKGTEYAGEEELDLAVVIAGIIIAIVILIFFLLGTFIGGRGKSEGGRYEPDTYSPPPEDYGSDMPPEGGDEGPPFPDEGPK
jgi:hypothetical protein